MIHMLKLQKCEGCNGTLAQINEHGLIRMCQDCGSTYKKVINQYGSDREEHPEFYLSQHEGKLFITPIDKKKDYILLPGGKIMPVRDDKLEKKLQNLFNS